MINFFYDFNFQHQNEPEIKEPEKIKVLFFYTKRQQSLFFLSKDRKKCFSSQDATGVEVMTYSQCCKHSTSVTSARQGHFVCQSWVISWRAIILKYSGNWRFYTYSSSSC